MKKRIIVIVALVCLGVILYPTALNLNFNKADDIEILLSKSLSSKKMSLFSLSLNRCIFNEINNKKINYNLLGVKFLSTQELLKSKNDKFHSVSIYINPKKDKASVGIQYYKASILYRFHYEKKNGSWQETESDWGRAKFAESKPYYIYWEIVRRVNPNYMDFKSFGIPKDSLK
jgi:hypothetical protein